MANLKDDDIKGSLAWAEEKLRRSNVDWHALLPEDVADRQVEWERQKTALAMRVAGITYREIGEKFGIGTQRARLFVARAAWRTPLASPVEAYLARLQSEAFENAEGLSASMACVG